MKLIKLLPACLLFTGVTFAQEWVDLKHNPNANFYTIQAKFNEYWKDKDETEKGKGYKQFKRWENYAEPRVYPHGDLNVLNQIPKNYQDWLENYNATHNQNSANAKFESNNMIASTTWTAIGPMGAISGNAGGQLLKSGRLNFVTIDPTNINNLWVGAPCGGLWKSTNGGTSWTTNTDNLVIPGCSDLAIDPTNTSIMYLATGDGDAGDYNSVGVLKSTNGGNTWATTGLTFNLNSGYLIRKLAINPSNTQIIMAATNAGVYRSTNGGANWSVVSTYSTTCHDIEFQPGNPNIVYVAGPTFKKSTDGGVTFTTISSGIPTTGINRMAIAVTPDDANYVYVLASNSSNNGFQGFYRSTNAGTTFSLMASSPNLLGWASAGNDSGGQGWYDLCIAASPLNKNEVVTGGVNVWRTTDGGSSWSLYGHWTGSGAPFTHADHHDLEYSSNGTLFNTNDGTVYRRSGTTWTEISGTMNISQIYKIGLSSLTANLWITGHQDNGTSTWNGTTYTARLGGDGMDCFIDRTNNNNMFGEYYNGAFRRSTNGGGSWSTVTTGLSGSAPWVTIWKQDPVNATRLYCGRNNMFVSNDLASNWTQLAALTVTAGTVREFAIAPSNNQVIYVVKSNAIMKTTNGGTSWSNITGTLSTSYSYYNLCVSPTDANKVWVVCANTSAGNKIFYSSNGGTSWTNYTSNLPNIPANCVVYEPGTSDRVYIGMDYGIYYRDNTQSTWTLYNAGLPNVPISDMEISPAMPTKLVAATYGRGVWIVDVVPTAAAPVTAFAFTGNVCRNTPKTFNDNSTNGPTSWSWSVTPSAGVTITTPTSQNPSITFANTGTYVVAMTASNVSGPGNTFTQSIVVYPTPTVTIASSVNTVCAGNPVTFTASGASSYSWACPTSSICNYSPTTSTNYVFVGTSSAGCTSSGSKSITVIPNVTVNVAASSTVYCATAQAVTLTATGASSYTWNPGNTTGTTRTVTPATNTTYTVLGTNGTCSNTKTITVTAAAVPSVNATASNSVFCSGSTQPVILTGSGATSYNWNPGNLSGTSVSVSPAAATVYTVTGSNGTCSNTKTISIGIGTSPVISAASSTSLLCAGTGATLTASGATSYSWSTGATTPTISVFPTLSTTYTVTGFNGPCSATTTVVQNVSWCTGISEQALLNSYKLFPNPFSNQLTIDAEEEVEITIINSLGQIVNVYTFEKHGIINTSEFASGIYFVNMKGNSGMKSYKLIKN